MNAAPSKAEQIQQAHEQSAERGRALLARAAEHNDFSDPALTGISAITDLLHALAEQSPDWSADDILVQAGQHFTADRTGEW